MLTPAVRWILNFWNDQCTHHILFVSVQYYTDKKYNSARCCFSRCNSRPKKNKSEHAGRESHSKEGIQREGTRVEIERIEKNIQKEYSKEKEDQKGICSIYTTVTLFATSPMFTRLFFLNSHVIILERHDIPSFMKEYQTFFRKYIVQRDFWKIEVWARMLSY